MSKRCLSALSTSILHILTIGLFAYTTPDLLNFDSLEIICFWAMVILTNIIFWLVSFKNPGFVCAFDLSEPVKVADSLQVPVPMNSENYSEQFPDHARSEPELMIREEPSGEGEDDEIPEHMSLVPVSQIQVQQESSAKILSIHHMRNTLVVEPRYCTICQIEQPIRAKHCRECGKCVALHDHHCTWLGTCIGQDNRFYFYWYLVW